MTSLARLALVSAAAPLAQEGDRLIRGAPEAGTREGVLLGLSSTIRGYIDPGAGAAGMALLCAVAFTYGMLHALGPGHQKSLIAGVTLADGGGLGRLARAAGIAAASHAISVIALFGGLAVLSGSLSLASGDGAARIVSAISGWMLVAMAIAMLVRRILSAARRARASSEIAETRATCATCATLGHANRGHERHAVSAPRASLLTVALGSLVPCPGAAFFLLYGFSAGNPLAGIAAVLAISAGMWVTLLAVGSIALLARGAGERATRNGRMAATLRAAFEIGGACLVLAFALGVAL